MNTRQNEVLRDLVREAVDPAAAWFMDLYAGAGNFTGVLSAAAPHAAGLAVEFSAAAVARGRVAHPGVEWVAADVARALAERTPRPGAGVILLDPPRTGCDRAVIDALVKHAPAHLLYVSCNPSTFARDAARLLEAGPYRIETARGLDMFPQTEHVELIASFRRH